MGKLAPKKVGSEDVRVRKRFQGWWPGGVRGEVNILPGDRRFGRKEEKKKGKKKERKKERKK